MKYSILASSFYKSYHGIDLSRIYSNNELIIESENKTSPDSGSSNKIDDEEEIRKKPSFTEILKMLYLYDLVAAFPNTFFCIKIFMHYSYNIFCK